MKKGLLIYFFACMSVSISAQTHTIDSLKKNISYSITEKQLRQSIFALCEQGYTLNPDTLMKYANKAKASALRDSVWKDVARAIYFQSYALTNKGLIDSSLAMANFCIGILSSRVSDPLLLYNVYNQKGRCYMRKSQYKNAIDMGYRVINGAEMERDTLLEIKGKTLIGWAYIEMGQHKESLNWHLDALHTTTDTFMLQRYGILFANMALNYSNLGKPDSGFYCIDKAILYSRMNENLFALSNSLAIKAQLLVRSDKGELAEEPLKEVVTIRKLIGDPFYIVSDMSQLGLYYAHNGSPEKGILLCKEGIVIARQFRLDTKLTLLYGTLAENYKTAGDIDGYAETMQQILALKDSVYQQNSAQALANLQTSYYLQKRESTIIQQKLAITKKDYLLYGSLLLSLCAGIIAWILFRGYSKRQDLKMKHMQEEEKTRAFVSIQQAEEKERKRIAADLHDNLGAYAASIASNLDYIGMHENKQEQRAAMQELHNNSQAIVSQLSDTIWALKKKTLTLTAISDRLKVFTRRIGQSYPDIELDVQENIVNDVALPPAQAFHLFQIVQEAIINAVKHSGSKRVILSIESDTSWIITITDGGKGIAAYDTEGNGLINMQNRAAESGWVIRWEKNEPFGTKVLIEPGFN